MRGSIRWGSIVSEFGIRKLSIPIPPTVMHHTLALSKVVRVLYVTSICVSVWRWQVGAKKQLSPH